MSISEELRAHRATCHTRAAHDAAILAQRAAERAAKVAKLTVKP